MAKKARTKSAKKGRPKQENRAQHRKAGHIEQELRKLFKGQAPIAGLLASIFASTATENAKLLRFVTDRHRISQAFTEPIDPARWLRLYRQHRHITQVVGSAMG